MEVEIEMEMGRERAGEPLETSRGSTSESLRIMSSTPPYHHLREYMENMMLIDSREESPLREVRFLMSSARFRSSKNIMMGTPTGSVEVATEEVKNWS